MKKFTLKSGNATPFKKMGSAPAKHEGNKDHQDYFVRGHLGHSSKYYQENNPDVEEINTKHYSPSDWRIMKGDKEKKELMDAGTTESELVADANKKLQKEGIDDYDPIVAARKEEKEEKKKEKERKKKQRRIKKHTL